MSKFGKLVLVEYKVLRDKELGIDLIEADQLGEEYY